MIRLLSVIGGVLFVSALIFVGLLFAVDKKHQDDTNALGREWQTRPIQKTATIGSTKTLEVLPLINLHAGEKDGLRTEPGVSYLVKTDTATVLFDVGFNRYSEKPSPLEHNMDLLGVSLSDIDIVFLSHAHRDHVGGLSWEKAGSFSLGNEQPDLTGKRAIAPIPLQYPGLAVENYSEPTYFASGLATTGAIARQLFVGQIDEQALVINLEGKGLVVIVGCGHQTVEKLLARIDESFDEPLYGLIGDLHYPVPKGRLYIAGIDAQRRLASGNGLFEPLTIEDVHMDLTTLKDRGLGLIALGGHDTSDRVLKDFEANFGDVFQNVKVGDLITVSSNEISTTSD